MPTRSTSHTSSHHHEDHANALAPPLQHSTSGVSAHSQSRLAYHRPSCQQEECEHGLLSPHASRPNSSSSTRARPNHSDDRQGHGHSEGLERERSGNGGVFGGRYAGEGHGILGDAFADGVLGGAEPGDGDGTDGGGGKDGGKRWMGAVRGMSTTQWLARKHGVRGRRTMYVYVPSILYLRYRLRHGKEVWENG